MMLWVSLISDRAEFINWVFSLSEDLLILDGDYVVFNFSISSSSSIDDAIDYCLKSLAPLSKAKRENYD